MLDENTREVENRSVPLYFVQEWIEGKTLAAAVEGKPRPLDEALTLTRVLAETVGHCHASAVYHRDIKPENIILSQNDNLTLVDFGIAWVANQFRHAGDRKTHVGQELGNRFLRLPELSSGQPKDDPRADVTFTVGILFFLLTGKYPRGLIVDNVGRPPHEAWENVFPIGTKADPRYRTRLRGLFRVGFQVAPDLRFQSAEALIVGLDEMLNPPAHAASAHDRQLAEFEEVMNSSVVRQRQEVEAGMMSASQMLERALFERANEKNLQPVGNAGGPYLTNGGAAVVTHIQVHRRNFQTPASNLEHTIARDEQDPSHIVASYKTDHGSKIYYRGPAADTERIEEEARNHADEIFGATLAVLTERLRGY